MRCAVAVLMGVTWSTIASAQPRRTPGFELGLGVGATRLECIAPCAPATHFSAGPLLVVGTLVSSTVFVGGQIVGSALDDDRDTELSLWAIMPVVKYYPWRSFYIGGGLGFGEADGTVDGTEVSRGIWAVEVRAAWTMSWNRAITPYVSGFRALSPLRVSGGGTSRQVRADSFQIGVALSTPGSR